MQTTHDSSSTSGTAGPGLATHQKGQAVRWCVVAWIDQFGRTTYIHYIVATHTNYFATQTWFRDLKVNAVGCVC